MNEEIKYCSRCTDKLGNSIIREESEMPVYNLLITKFSEGDLGSNHESHNLCWKCKSEFDEWMKEKKKEEQLLIEDTEHDEWINMVDDQINFDDVSR